MRSMTKSADMCGGKSSKTCPEFISGWQKKYGKWQIVATLLLLTTYHLSLTTQVYGDAPKISGHIDTTYNYDFNRPPANTNLRSFGRHDNFLLNAAQVNIEGSKDGIGYYAELAFGDDPMVYNANAGDAVNLQEAFLTYKWTAVPLMVKAGKFVTFQGIEVIESHLNPTVTRGYLFGLAEPYDHVGAVVGYEFPKYVDIWLGAVNGWDRDRDNNMGKTFVWKLGIKVNEKFWGSFQGYYGAEQTGNALNQRTSFDTVWYLKPMEMLTLAWQINAGGEQNVPGTGASYSHWYGFGLQPTVKFNDTWSLGARYEWFQDLTGVQGFNRLVAQNFTVTPTVNLTENLMFRLDLRHDWTPPNVSPFTKAETPLDGSVRSDATSIATEFVYKF